MRVHHLSVTAFGPFAGTETIDFDDLNDAGIFLLAGPTGAGKTSILDAICFALYGVVPGERGVKALRSHHAGVGVAPEVTLEVSLGERRFRVKRSPEWSRAKKVGEGETKQQAKASLMELTGGIEHLVSDRISEVSHELRILLGMTPEQFMQVVMLPQGEFQTFLQAKSDDRQKVLEKLFQTQRFGRIEEWMKAHTSELRSLAARGEAEVRRLLHTISERSGALLPEALTDTALAANAGELALPWAVALTDQARDLALEATSKQDGALAELEAAEESLNRAQAQSRAIARHVEARAILADLDASDETAQARVKQLALHASASAVEPLLVLLRRAEEASADAETARARVAGTVQALPLTVRPAQQDVAAVKAALTDHTESLLKLKALLDRETELEAARGNHAATTRALAEQVTAIAAWRARAEALPAERTEIEAALTASVATAARRESDEAALLEAVGRQDAAGQLPQARLEHERLVDVVRDRRDQTHAARTRHLDLVARRLSGMAAELAGQLQEGDPCQVCGSVDHPAPATGSSDPVTADQQRAAEADARYAEELTEQAVAAAAAAERKVSRLEAAASGMTLEAAQAHLLARQAALQVSLAAERDRAGLTRTLSELTAEGRSLDENLQVAQARRGSLQSDLATTQEIIEAISAEIGQALTERWPTLSAAIAAHESALAVLESAISTETVAQNSATHAAGVLEQTLEAAATAGFADLAAVEAAVLASGAVAQLTAWLDVRSQRRARAEAALADVDLEQWVVGDAAPNLAAAAEVRDLARELATANAKAATLAQARSEALTRLSTELGVALAEWAPHRERLLTAESMTQLVRGGGHNLLQMRLSSFVLATRLDQVLDAANERLGHMRDQRYVLRRTGAASRRGSQAGLGLEILDDWTGEARSPLTLSGGETFVVSLALALGLADVVSHETGGLHVDTLFIDEGFGMLDADTLDDVMDRIDALRAGGRTVGVVSHVGELRNRIPTQVHVRKERDGSTITVSTLVA